MYTVTPDHIFTFAEGRLVGVPSTKIATLGRFLKFEKNNMICIILIDIHSYNISALVLVSSMLFTGSFKST